MKTIIIDGVEYNLTPKVAFHEGDWLIHKNIVNEPCCIAQIHAPHYYLTNKNSFIKFGEEDNYRPWTIQDAKDGDVLFIGIDGSTCIFKKLEGNLLYSYIISNEKLLVEDSHYYYETSDNVHPATKEQRDLLFQKMKEAGYEWNAEKKELKKIEQKPTKWHREDEQNLNACLGYIPDEFLRRWLQDAIHTRYDKPAAWSEEDEKIINNLLWIIEAYRKNGFNEMHTHVADISENWLKALKDRYTWKPSESDIRILEQVIDGIANPLNYHTTLHAILEKLKKLREE